jgi:hypothetical protein
MSWIPRYHHMSQMEDWRDGGGLNGHNNCGPASCARWLREAGYPSPGSDHDLIAHVRFGMTGQQEYAAEGYISLDQVRGYLKNLDILVGEATADARAAAAPWALSLVRGPELYPAQYPRSWFGVDAPDHFILSLPGGLINDPLAYFNGQQDCAYTSLAQAIVGGWSFLLKDPYTVSWSSLQPGKYRAVPKAVPPPPLPPTQHDPRDYAAFAQIERVRKLVAPNIAVGDARAVWKQLREIAIANNIG